MKRSKSLGLSTFTAQLTLSPPRDRDKDKMSRPKTMFYKMKLPEGKVGRLKKYWNSKVSLFL